MARGVCALAGWVVIVSMSAAGQAPARARADRATVPLILEGNRPYIDLTFRRADGTTRQARFLVDSGGGGFLMTEPLARDLGVRWGPTSKEEGAEFGSATTVPSVSVGDLALD